MGDDARTRGTDVLDAAYSLPPIADPNAVQVGGGHVVVTYEQAVDALLAAGWRPPVSDDAKAKAFKVADAAIDGAQASGFSALRAVAALADAGLLAEPSHLDRLAAWADEHDERVRLDRWPAALSKWAVATPLHAVNELDEDVQVAARRVLARLEATDG